MLTTFLCASNSESAQALCLRSARLFTLNALITLRALSSSPKLKENPPLRNSYIANTIRTFPPDTRTPRTHIRSLIYFASDDSPFLCTAQPALYRRPLFDAPLPLLSQLPPPAAPVTRITHLAQGTHTVIHALPLLL